MTDDEMLGELADCISEAVKEELVEELEPFELYAHQLRYRLQMDMEQFRSRFIQGYKVLIEVLKSGHLEG